MGLHRVLGAVLLMSLTEAQRARRRHVKRKLLQRRGYQFGQPNCGLATAVSPGDVACMDTSIQLVKYLCDDKMLSIDAIRRISGAPAHRPFPNERVLPTLLRLGLPYQFRNSLTAAELWEIVLKKGPVLFAEDYWAHPHWNGYVYAGVRMTGVATNRRGNRVVVGTADPDRKAGNNQWSFKLGHAGVFAFAGGDWGHKEAGLRDPNHNSAVRPERPAWDKVSLAQLNRQLRSFNLGQNRAMWVPTEVVVR